MEQFLIERNRTIRIEKKMLEEKLSVKITLNGKNCAIDGDPLNEYEAKMVIEAIDFGFSPQIALKLKKGEAIFRSVNIKDHTTRNNLEQVRARLIGKKGKTKKTMEDISDIKIVLNGNTVGIIGPADEIEFATTGIINIIRGSKQSNVYSYLEMINRTRTDRQFSGKKI